MKKIYIKYKILLNGFNPTEECNIDGFNLKRGFFDKSLFDFEYKPLESSVFTNMNLYLYSCITNTEKLTYNYFESEDFVQYEVSNKINKHNITSVLTKYPNIIERVNDLEKKIRLVFNIPVLFQNITIEFYDENKEFINLAQSNKHISFWNRLTYNLPADEFYNNSRFNMNYKFTKNTNNKHFERALEIYNQSFESDNRQIRYILIFGALEAIFNLDTKEVTKKLAKYSAKLLSESNNEDYEKIKTDIKQLYNKRCKYIHGSNINCISDEDEKQLRRYVRKIILIYWMIIMVLERTAKQILEYLDSDNEIDLQIKLFISALNASNFTEQQEKGIKLIEKELGRELPANLKAKMQVAIQKK